MVPAPHRRGRTPGSAGDRDSGAELDAEDDALLLRAWQLRAGALPAAPGGRPLRYRHIAVDEVQDFSPLEVRVLMDQLDERRSLTLAGDTQQHVATDSGFTSWSEFFAHLGLEGTEVETLQVSYRSSEEITRFALAAARRPARGRCARRTPRARARPSSCSTSPSTAPRSRALAEALTALARRGAARLGGAAHAVARSRRPLLEGPRAVRGAARCTACGARTSASRRASRSPRSTR